ncbi:MAG TPA: hypothetical protein VMU29_09090 [Smithella sp.]|nr:hypothetical protein [Smithella sp.]
MKLAADVGIDRNPDEDANNDPVFVIGGIIYSIKKTLMLISALSATGTNLKRIYLCWPELPYDFKDKVSSD